MVQLAKENKLKKKKRKKERKTQSKMEAVPFRETFVQVTYIPFRLT